MLEDSPQSDATPSVWEVFISFLKLGLTSFGGPIAHLGFFQNEFVNRRKWLSETYFADLVALCQFLPGPASSQVGFAIGYNRRGLPGALAAWTAFTLPSALLMIACAYSLAYFDPVAPWVHGLKIAAVAVVAQAIWSMAAKLCPDRLRATLAILAACLLLFLGSAWAQVLVIILGMVIGIMLICPTQPDAEEQHLTQSPYIKRGPLPKACLALFLGLLALLPVLNSTIKTPWLDLTDGFYRAGALVFGGGHVVLPLLEAETVTSGWVTQDEFLAGYGAAQAVPGPLFTFSAYLGTLSSPTAPLWLGGIFCLIVIFLPSLLLVIGVLPYWDRLRQNHTARSALAGANAAVVGLLIAAFYDPIWTAAITTSRAFILALLAFGALQFWRCPPWLLVILCGLLGQLIL